MAHESGDRTVRLLSVRDLQAAYDKILALHGVSIEVSQGKIVTVLGANGAGKTTLLRCISGLLRLAGGGITFSGRSLAGLPAERVVGLGISHVPEGRLIFPNLTVYENLLMGGYLTGKQQVREGVDRACTYFPVLGNRLHQAGGTLSGGEQQMLAIARALMLRPRLMLLDEPSLGIAPVVKEQIFDILQTIREREDVSMLLVEQDSELALSVCDYAYVLETGRVVAEGKGEELARDDSLRKAYLGA